MVIKDGGQTRSLGDGPVKSIDISYAGNRVFNLMINGDSLSYLSLDEILNLRDEINNELKRLLNPEAE
jgi:hypothetical protein